jgi:hypothetical protein
VVGPEVVATAAAMAACSCCDVTSTAIACSEEAVAAAWTVARAAAKSDRAMVSGLRGSRVTMAGRWVDADLYYSSWAVEEEQLAGQYRR